MAHPEAGFSRVFIAIRPLTDIFLPLQISIGSYRKLIQISTFIADDIYNAEGKKVVFETSECSLTPSSPTDSSGSSCRLTLGGRLVRDLRTCQRHEETSLAF